MAMHLPETAAEAEARFYARYADLVGGGAIADVQRYLGGALRVITPTTVEGWVALAEAVRDHVPAPAPTPAGWVALAEAVRDRSMPAPAPAPAPTPAPRAAVAAAALTFALEVRVRVNGVEGPLTISGGRLQDVLTAVGLLPQTPGLRLVEEARSWQTLPDGTPICPKHNVPMRKREKQGDEWYSHSVDHDGKACFCKGYAGKDSPGWAAE